MSHFSTLWAIGKQGLKEFSWSPPDTTVDLNGCSPENDISQTLACLGAARLRTNYSKFWDILSTGSSEASAFLVERQTVLFC